MLLTRAKNSFLYGYAGLGPVFAVAIAMAIFLYLASSAAGDRDTRITECLSQFKAGPRVCVKHFQFPDHPEGDTGHNLAFRCGKSYTEEQVKMCRR